MRKRIDGEVYFTPKQAAEHFNLSLSTIKNYIYAGKLKTLKTPGGHHRIRKTELLSTLGDLSVHKEEIDNISLMESLCATVLSVFKALGPIGNSLTMHARRVAGMSLNLARAMDMSGPEVKHIEMAGLVHDIGLIGIERRILSKSGILTPQEYESIKDHPLKGEEMLSSISQLKDIVGMVAQHHERIDGSGYPRGLKSERIKRGARIISIAEAYDSMVSPYSYKQPVSKDMAIAELIQKKESQFDGDIVELFVKMI